jgi:hypothetical protein
MKVVDLHAVIQSIHGMRVCITANGTRLVELSLFEPPPGTSTEDQEYISAMLMAVVHFTSLIRNLSKDKMTELQNHLMQAMDIGGLALDHNPAADDLSRLQRRPE